MKRLILALCCLSVLSLGACAGFYVAGDAGASAPADTHRSQ